MVKRRFLHKIIGPVLFLGILLGLASGCSTSECFDNQNSLPLAGFYSSEPEPRPISLDSISILGIGAPGDSILQDSVRTLSEVYLPFRIDQPSTTYEIRYLGGEAGIFRVSDFITFNYEIIPMFVSSACGTVYYYKMESINYTDNFIDSVVCPEGKITNANIENLKIYFRVALEEEKE
ncbi:MAG: hypothetical protein J1F12_07715 [Muribaculaceae bacterium]|nr:hypothetical protein [Muribaculaceae bacterium]